MIERFVASLREPRAGMVTLTALLTVLMASHWAPLVIPALAVLAIALARPDLAATPAPWWILTAAWILALILAEAHMEDHVLLFCAWLAALAIGLRLSDNEQFISEIAWHARALIAITFSAAVAWKLWFGDFISGAALWLFLLIDQRFAPLARFVGLDSSTVAHDRVQVSDVLVGVTESYTLQGSPYTTGAILAVAAATLVLEAVIAVSHLARDPSRLARWRLPALVTFAVATYSVVPVLPFAALLAVMGMAASRWRPETMWVFPVMFLIPVTRLVTLAL